MTLGRHSLLLRAYQGDPRGVGRLLWLIEPVHPGCERRGRSMTTTAVLTHYSRIISCALSAKHVYDVYIDRTVEPMYTRQNQQTRYGFQRGITNRPSRLSSTVELWAPYTNGKTLRHQAIKVYILHTAVLAIPSNKQHCKRNTILYTINSNIEHGTACRHYTKASLSEQEAGLGYLKQSTTRTLLLPYCCTCTTRGVAVRVNEHTI